MMLGENSGLVPPISPQGDVSRVSSDNMFFGGAALKSFQMSERDTFSEIVDKACDGLIEKQFKYTIRKIKKMEEFLCAVEHELDEFLALRDQN